MADDSEGSRSATRLDDVILDGKLSIPDVRQGMVSRAVVIDAARASSALAVGVTAPAGYGKSTLLTEWARSEDREVGWVSLDRLDDDPSVLLVLLAAAYARAFPGQRDLVADVRGLVTSPLGRAAPHLATALRRSPRNFVLMLDDLHELHSPSCHDVLSVVISGVPAGSQLVSASRDEQPHLTRLRATGAAREVRVGDLALDETGAKQIFATAHVPISPQQATTITARTEGWAAGLYLAAVIARTGEQDAWTVAGDDRYLADYLYRESLSQLDHDTQRFLRRTAVLDRFCAPLCDALSGATDGQDRLLALEASNSFLVPLDRRRAWYRYHPLFREFLLGELVRAEPEDVATLHVRAADWFEANDAPAMALEHLLDTPERDRCARLLSQLVLPTYSDGQISTVQRWLSALGDAAIRDYPPLAVLAGWTAVLGGEALAAHRWAAIADDASFDETPVDGTASFESSRAMLRAIMCPAGPAQMLADAAFALDSEPPWSPWRDTALCVAAEAYLLAGNVDEASRLFVETSASGSELGNTDTIVDAEATLALIAMDRGRWDTAAEPVGRALAVIDEHRMHDYAASALAFAVAARLALRKSEVAQCDRQLMRAMRARPACTYALPIQAVRGRLQLAKVFWVRGDQATARHLMREIDDVLLRRPDLGVLVDQVAEFRAVVGPGGHAGVPGGPPLTPAELRLLPYLQTHLTMGEIGQRLFVSRNTVATEVASIYRKLGVSSRTEAVEHATAIGLLGA